MYRLIPYIRFARMTSQEIVEYVQPSGVLNAEQLMKILSYQLAEQKGSNSFRKTLEEPLSRPRADGNKLFHGPGH